MEKLKLEDFEGYEYLECVHKDTDKTQNCQEYCCGITNFCGEYKNVLGIDPFEKCAERGGKI